LFLKFIFKSHENTFMRLKYPSNESTRFYCSWRFLAFAEVCLFCSLEGGGCSTNQSLMQFVWHYPTIMVLKSRIECFIRVIIYTRIDEIIEMIIFSWCLRFKLSIFCWNLCCAWVEFDSSATISFPFGILYALIFVRVFVSMYRHILLYTLARFNYY
jgi:hypothetical protein